MSSRSKLEEKLEELAPKNFIVTKRKENNPEEKTVRQ